MSPTSTKFCSDQGNDLPLTQAVVAHSTPRLSKFTSPRPIRESIAKRSEDYVASLLRLRGWKILGRNFRAVGTELDIIACKGPVTTIFEVKARRRMPACCDDLIPRKKRLALERGARIFLARRKIPYTGVCFDLVIVLFRNQFDVVGLKYFPRAFEALLL